MQLNGIGNSHETDMHHVTNCLHDHAQSEKSGGASLGVQGADSRTLQTAEMQAEAQFSLSAWLEKTLNSGKKLWGNVWGSRRQDADQGLPQKLHTPQIAAAATAVTQTQDIQNNPYFSAVERTDDQQGNLWQRIRVKFKNAAGQLAGHLPGKFFNAQTRSSFQAGQEQPKEDLRKRSKFRKDEVEIDCVLTDDSHLLDSYDRKGEYSKLSAQK